jgi:hypothetical protein
MSDLRPGDFCHFRFDHFPRGIRVALDFYGTVIKAYDDFVLIEDNDGHPYLVWRKDLKYDDKHRKDDPQNC